MSIMVRLHPILQNLAGGQELIEVNGKTTGECLEDMESRFSVIKQLIHDKRGQLRRYFEILVNSKSTYPKELTTQVKDGDQIDIMIFVAGGYRERMTDGDMAKIIAVCNSEDKGTESRVRTGDELRIKNNGQ